MNVAKMDPALPVEERIVRSSIDLFGEGDKSVLGKVSVSSVAIRVSDMGAYLGGVRVHPFVEGWHVDLVGRLCVECGIPFLGRSALYERPC